MIRAFLGVALPEEVADALVVLQTDLPHDMPGTLVPAENFHITLAFLGNQPRTVLEDVHLALDPLRSPRFRLSLAGADLFGGARPRAVIARVAPSQALSDLQKRVSGAVRSAEIDLPHKRFQPHVTLARLRSASAADTADMGAFAARHTGFRSAEFAVDEVCLYRSTLRRGGPPTYEIMAAYPLR